MSLQSLSRAFSAISSAPPRRPSSAAPKFGRRAPLVGALCILSLGTLSAIAYRGCAAQFLRRFHLLGPKVVNQASSRVLHSTAMEGASTTVPSIVVYVTVPNREAGEINKLWEHRMMVFAEGCSWVPSVGTKLAKSIITEKLAACVNQVPGIQSVYWWDGKVQTDAEELLIIKTRESLLGALTEHVKSNHEYDVPEVIALPITGGNENYLEWLKDSTRDN